MAWVSSWGTTPHGQDTINTLLKRIASSASGGGGGGGGGGSNTNDGGVVDPEGVVSAVQWARYYNSANATDWVRTSPGTGNTGWQQVS